MYYYRVKAYNSIMTGDYTDSIACGFRKPSTVPEKPSGLVAISDDGITLIWKSPPSTVGYIGYRIFRSTSMSADSSDILMSVDTTLRDVPPERHPTVYYYRVSAYNQRGESAPTNWVSAYRE